MDLSNSPRTHFRSWCEDTDTTSVALQTLFDTPSLLTVLKMTIVPFFLKKWETGLKTRAGPVPADSPVPVDRGDSPVTTPDRFFWGVSAPGTTPDRGFWKEVPPDTAPDRVLAGVPHR